MSKILLSAYACRPNTGSEPGIGWNFAVHAALDHDVWVMTRPDNRPFIDAALQADPTGPASRVRFHYVPWPRLSGKIPGKLIHVRYTFWQREAARAARRLHAEVKFDLAHHVTYGCYWQPAGVVWLDDVPTIWGPVGGGETAPGALLGELAPKARLKERARDLARFLGERSGAVRRTARCATIGLAATRETADRMTRLGTRQVEVFTAMGLTAGDIDALAAAPTTGPGEPGGGLRLVSVGRLLDWKGFHLGLRAFAAAQLPAGSRYDVIGDGPAKASLVALAESLGIASRVHFHGALTRDRTLAQVGRADVLVHPSLHDSGGWVILEAMAMGKAVLCLDLHGPALMATGDTGIKVPVQSSGQVVTDLIAGMERLAREPGLLARMGDHARARARETFSWAHRRHELAVIYERVLGAPATVVSGEAR